MLLALVAPLVMLFRASLNRFDPTELMISALTAENYLRFFADPFYWNVLVTTIRVSIIVTVVCGHAALGATLSGGSLQGSQPSSPPRSQTSG